MSSSDASTPLRSKVANKSQKAFLKKFQILMNKTDEIDTLYNNKLKDLAHHKHAYDDHEPTCSSEKQGLTSMSSEIRDSNIEQFNIERVTPGVLADKNSSKFMTE